MPEDKEEPTLGVPATTSLHVPGPLTNKPLLYQLTWVLLLLGSSAIFTIHFYSMVQQYNSKPISTAIKQSAVPFVFPELIICNNIISSKSTIIRQFMNLLKFDSTYITPLIANASMQRGFMKFVEWLQIIRASRKDNMLLQLYGHDIKDLLLHCDINGHIPCSVEDFEEYSHDIYLRCYKFKPNTTEAIYTVEMMIFAESLLANDPTMQMQNTPFSTIRWDGTIRWDTSAGAVLYMFPKGESPSESNKMQLSTGHETFIKLNQLDILSLNTGSRPCQLNGTQVIYRDFDEKTELKYQPSIDDCYKLALLKKYESQCGCFPTTRLLVEFNNTGKGFCYDYFSSSSKTEMQDKVACHKNVSSEENDIMIHSGCNNLCRRRTYSRSISSIKWPLDPAVINTVDKFVKPSFQRCMSTSPPHYSFGLHTFINMSDGVKKAYGIMASMNKTNPQYMYAEYNATTLRNNLLRMFSSNFLRFKLFAADSRGSVIEESFSYSFDILMSNFGGVLGMYLGFSLMSLTDFMEFFYLMYKYIAFQFRRKAIMRRRARARETKGAIKQTKNVVRFVASAKVAAEDTRKRNPLENGWMYK